MQAKSVRNRLDRWWVEFDGVTWLNFGQQEGRAALGLFDRLFGQSLWSWRRWISVILIYYLTFAPLLLGDLVKQWSALTWTYRGPSLVTIQLVGMALSLSLTRWLTERVVRLTGAWSILGFLMLFILSIFLLVVWWPVLFAVKYFLTIAAPPWADFSNEFQKSLVFPSWHEARNHLLSPVSVFKQAMQLMRDESHPYWLLAPFFAANLADYVISTVRIFFSAFFVGCFGLRRFVHRPLSRLGFIWLTSGKPIFATLFAAIGAVIVFGLELIKATSP